MHDRTISATRLTSVALWVIGALLAVADIFFVADVGALGMVLAAGGATITVRGFFCTMLSREQAAFELGRESARAARLSAIRPD